jgi:hypothetical protein
MAIGQRTVSINAAFLQEIKDDHHELRQLMHHAGATLERSGPTEIDLPRLVELLGKTRDQLALHFSLEEAYGYHEDAITAAPHLCRRAEQLRAQHAWLFGEFCRLVESAEMLLYLEQPESAVTQVARDFRRFSTRFHEHESQESDLVLEALNDDIGTGD